MATLDLPDGPQTLVWRLIRDRLMADPRLKAVIHTWLVWDDAPLEGSDLDDTTVSQPAMRLFPILDPMTWYYADSQKGSLVVQVEASTPNLDVEDVMNLQFAIERCFYPPDRAEETAFEQALVSAGAETGLITFNVPLNSDQPKQDQGGFRIVGRFSVVVLRKLMA